MAVQPDDIEVVPVREEWVAASVAYAQKSWWHTYNRMGKQPYDRIHKIAQGLVQERALLHWLDVHGVPHDLSGRTRWYEQDRHDLGVCGRSADLKGCFLNLDGSYLRTAGYPDELASKLAWLLDCHALIPADQLQSGRLRHGSLYLFSFLESHLMPEPDLDLHTPHQRLYPLHAFRDYEWVSPAKVGEDHVGRVRLKSDSQADRGKRLVLWGTDGPRSLATEEIVLKGRTWMRTSTDFYQVISATSPDGRLPVGSVVLRSSAGCIERVEPEFGYRAKRVEGKVCVSQNDWMNMWAYGGRVYLAGYATKRWFLESDCVADIPRFCKDIKQYSDTLCNNVGCLVCELEPMSSLLGSGGA